MATFEVKKMKQGMSYSCKEKTIILNVFKYFRTQLPDKCVTDIVRRTAKATGCSEKSIFQFRKEEASPQGFKEPSKTKIRKNININSRDIKYDSTVRQAIRNVIYDLKYRNIVPSLNTILKQVNADNQLPNFSLMTLRRLMFDMGFCYEKNGNKSVLVEKRDSSFQNGNTENIPHNSDQNKQTNQIIPNNSNNISNVKVLPQVPQTVHSNHPQLSINEHTQEQRHVSVLPYDNHFMSHLSHSGHGMPMLTPRRDLLPPPPHHMGPSNMDMHMKRDIPPPWMHSHNMIKQQ